MDPESVLPLMEVDIKDENSFENQNGLQFCSENQSIQSSSNIADVYDFSQIEVPKKNEDINTPLNPNIKEEPRDVGTILNPGGPTMSGKSKADNDVDFDDSGLSNAHQLPASLEGNNPWDVCSLFEFNYFCCPECEFKTRSYSIEQSAQDFVNHASSNHPWAVNFLQQISDGSIDNVILPKENNSSQIKVEIKQEPEEDFELPLAEFEFEGDYLETEMCDELTNRGVKKSVQNKKIILKKPKMIDRNEKPKMSLSQLISEALVNSRESMSVTDIAKSISAKYPFYKLENQKWQNSLTSRIGEMERKNAEKKNAVVNMDPNIEDSKLIVFEESIINNFEVHEEKKTYQSHQCTICNREFVGKNAKRNMNDHVAVVHEGKKPFQCEICKSCFSRERNLRAHISFVHEGNTPFQCTECNEGFGYKHLFDRHIKLKHDKIPYTPYQCTICKKEFSGVNGKRNMNQHVAVVHEGKKPFQCEICNSCFSKKVGLEKHISSVHDGNKPFKCNLCQYATVHKGDLTRHVESVHEGKKPYQCTICKKDFAGLRHMKEHVAVVHEGKKPFQCETCNSCFSRKDKLRTHISSVHEGIKPFKCYICQYATVRKGDLDKHIKEVHSPENNFECENCGKKCKSKEAYNTHRKYYEGKCQPPNLTEKIMLQNPEPGICPHCGEYFERVQQHILYMHTTEKPYKCPKCEFAHTLKKGLDSHMKTVHPVESALKICHICSYKTSTNQTLRNHIESVHEQIKNFSCPHDGCDLKFYRERTMKKHFMLKHSSERPHKCEICGEAFAIKEKLQTHKRKVHEGKKYSCETCGKEHNNAKSLKRHNVNLHGMDKKRKLKFDSSDH